ncbi:odorant receptor 4-like [Scaptodrosophila lebanonensis]|uniref:Odorant receptor n=1 Tax=Drosophila lebanonensis TaxID=7225 RepID=A0A6J2TKH0_DROLE|nr:odorant receptor 4-like [Scaptodrosophila lebanonensis]
MLKWVTDRVFPSEPATGRLGSVDFNLWLAQIVGVPLNGMRGEARWVQIVALIYGLPVLLFVAIIYCGCELYDLLLNLHSLNIFTQNICLSLTRLAGLFKISNTFYCYADIKYIIEQFREMTKRYVQSTKQKRAFDRGEFANKVPLMIYSILVSFTGFLGMWMLIRNPIDVAGKVFPFRVYMPLWLPNGIKLAYMSFSVIISALQIVAIDYLNITLMNQICLQLQILNLTFDELLPLDINPLDEKSCEPDPNMTLRAAIKHHCELRALGLHIEMVYRTPVLIQFVASLVIFGVTGFQAIVTPAGSNGAVLIYFYCGCIFCELFLYCWFGNEVHEQSKTLASSAFSAPWYRFDRTYQKSLLIFITNAQKPFLFTAGSFMGLSLPSFAGILSKSYSFIAVLRQVYSK